MFEQLDDCLNSIQVDARETALAVKTLTERLDKVEIIGANGFGKINDATTAARKAAQVSKEVAGSLESLDTWLDDEFAGFREDLSRIEDQLERIEGMVSRLNPPSKSLLRSFWEYLRG